MPRFRTAGHTEIDTILHWAAEEGWNPGVADAEAFFAADPGGFFLAEDAGGAPVAAISVVNHSDAYAFLGLYIVTPPMRGQGIGLALWTHALAHAGDRVVGLDGVPEQQANYAASGFTHAGGTTRFTGEIAGHADPDLRAVRPEDLSMVIAAEAAASGVAKPAYLTAWLADTPARTTLVLPDGPGIRGFCTVRQCRDGAKIGPLVAPDAAAAARMIAHAATCFAGPVTLDAPETEPALAGICAEHGMSAGFKTARMYRGPGPVRGPFAGCYAVGTLELG